MCQILCKTIVYHATYYYNTIKYHPTQCYVTVYITMIQYYIPIAQISTGTLNQREFGLFNVNLSRAKKCSV